MCIIFFGTKLRCNSQNLYFLFQSAKHSQTCFVHQVWKLHSHYYGNQHKHHHSVWSHHGKMEFSQYAVFLRSPEWITYRSTVYWMLKKPWAIRTALSQFMDCQTKWCFKCLNCFQLHFAGHWRRSGQGIWPSSCSPPEQKWTLLPPSS